MANRLAHFARKNNVVDLVIGIIPNCLQDVLVEDSCTMHNADFHPLRDYRLLLIELLGDVLSLL